MEIWVFFEAVELKSKPRIVLGAGQFCLLSVFDGRRRSIGPFPSCFVPEARPVEPIHLGALAELAVQAEEPLDLVLLKVRLAREGVDQLGLLLPNYLADFRHFPAGMNCLSLSTLFLGQSFDFE